MIETLEQLEALYDAPKQGSLDKVMDHLSGAYAAWIEASRFVVISTVGPEGTDASPRGDVGPVALQLDDKHLGIPDWRGNNRLDTLRNIIRDPRIALMFMVTGSRSTMRVNGRAHLSDDPDLIARFEVKGRHPVCVIVVKIDEVYSQCPKAFIRSDFWTAETPEVPSPGDMLADASSGKHGGAEYDARYDDYAKETMW